MRELARMQKASGRTVGIHLTHGGEYFGLLGPYEVDGGWWSSAAPVVERVSQELGVPVVVLRLAHAPSDGSSGHGGHVLYHLEALERPAGSTTRQVTPDVAALLGPAERRAGWATTAGLREALDWAEETLDEAGRPAAGRPEQVRTWNLSGLFRFHTADGGEAWLKTVNPAFNAPEGLVIALLGSVDPTLVPTVLGSAPERGRLLLDHVSGEDLWRPSAEEVVAVVPRLVAAQAALAADGRAAAAGLRDRTLPTLVAHVNALLDRLVAERATSPGPGPDGAGEQLGDRLTAEELAAARALAARLPALVEELTACGLPNTLVHGDFHPGNWRSDGTLAVIVDYADSAFGHPALDGLRPRQYVDGERWTQIAEVWARAWREHVPGSAPERALELVEPLFHLAYAVRYQEFLDHIETSERPYHETDPVSEVRRALACVRPGLTDH
ncbi:phosphotransferase [Streptomyces erythrochromogenes]|uniref:phosphotransferase n=1 Tax=Streptomyces erythrochromogenes TaxID=285574 RepID=UPI0022598FF8|nr:phosphotransferase [Streptomyces erythrochromogenes]MCX5588728.1 aminoglycoside phosphotransferase family protein [Streptomyces erythrochromogenes]